MGKALGTIGDFGCYSFHETKNISMGEGGALLIRDAANIEKAEIIREKGTNRSKFFRGEIDKYSWVDQGSSYLPSEYSVVFQMPDQLCPLIQILCFYIKHMSVVCTVFWDKWQGKLFFFSQG